MKRTILLSLAALCCMGQGVSERRIFISRPNGSTYAVDMSGRLFIVSGFGYTVEREIQLSPEARRVVLDIVKIARDYPNCPIK